LPEGAATTLEAIAASLYEQQGAFMGNIVIFRDMTEIKRLQDEVIRSQRLASLGGLAAGVAHEIRNPLSSIKGFAAYFRDKFTDVPTDREAAEVMIHEVDRMNRVITQLIEFARPLKMSVNSVSLPVVIRHALTLVEKDAAKMGISIETEIPPGKWEIPVDADQMTQVFLNLYLNAIASMEKGGTLRVSLSAQDEKLVRISVSDTGIGIPAADIPRIFDPYFTTRSGGTGLGLAICHKIVEAHNGEIFVESEEGKGTNVVVTLPAASMQNIGKTEGK
jgi:two-component system sensor histidine kinase HydH